MIHHRGGGLWSVTGALDMASVPSVFGQTAGLFDNAPVVIDLAAVERIDSAGLALMVHWLRESRRLGVAIRFQHIPVRLLPLAKMCGLEQLLPPEAYAEQQS